MDPNPYAAPQSAPSDLPASGQIFRVLVKSWEKYRLLYNGILLLPGIGVVCSWASIGPMSPLFLIGFPILCGIGANVAFFAGPLAELYLRALVFTKSDGLILRRFLLGGGLAISFAIMAVAAVLPWFAPADTGAMGETLSPP